MKEVLYSRSPDFMKFLRCSHLYWCLVCTVASVFRARISRPLKDLSGRDHRLWCNLYCCSRTTHPKPPLQTPCYILGLNEEALLRKPVLDFESQFHHCFGCYLDLVFLKRLVIRLYVVHNLSYPEVLYQKTLIVTRDFSSLNFLFFFLFYVLCFFRWDLTI